MKTILNKAFMLGKIFNVVEVTDFLREPAEYVQYYGNTLAVHYLNLILPVYPMVSNITLMPGMYLSETGGWEFITTGDNIQEYSDSKLARIGDAETFQDIVEAKEQLYRDEYNHLITNDDIFVPQMKADDTALMFAVKSAIAAKQCNINNYAERFGNDFNNDKRKFNGNSITAGKAETILSNTDVRVTLVIQDMNPEVANPIGKALVFPWIGDGINDDKYVNYINDAIASKGPIEL